MATPTPHLDPDLLSAYLDDEVTTAERAQVDIHLAGCARCRTELEGLRRVTTLLQALPLAQPPRTFYVTEAMVEPAPTDARRSWLAGWQQWLGGLATAVGLLLCMVVVQMQGMGGAASPVAVQQEGTSAGAEMAQPAERAVEEGAPPITMATEADTTEAEEGMESTTIPLAAAPTPVAEAEGGAVTDTSATETLPPVVAPSAAEGGESAGEEPGESELGMMDSAIVSPTLTITATTVSPGPVVTEVGVIAEGPATALPRESAPPAATPVPPTTRFNREALPLLALALLLLVGGGLLLWRARGPSNE